tara:strand:+ start:2621 stop:2851 length:231 start_codon:yes stop_codon:yes gene_type:complete
MSKNAAELYKRIKADDHQTQLLFRQALQDPNGAISSICQLGIDLDLPVTPDEVKTYLASLDDAETKQWIVKARGGL